MYHIYTVFALFFKSVITIEKQSERLRFLKNYKDLVTYISLQNYPVVLLLVGVRQSYLYGSSCRKQLPFSMEITSISVKKIKLRNCGNLKIPYANIELI